MLSLTQYKRRLYFKKILFSMVPLILVAIFFFSLAFAVDFQAVQLPLDSLKKEFGLAYLFFYFSLGFYKSFHKNVNRKSYKAFLATLPMGKSPFGNIRWQIHEAIIFLLMVALPYLLLEVSFQFCLVWAFIALAWGYAITCLFYLRKEVFWLSLIVTILCLGKTISLELYAFYMLFVLGLIQRKVRSSEYTSWLKVDITIPQNIILPTPVVLNKSSKKDLLLGWAVFCLIYSYISWKLIVYMEVNEPIILFVPMLISLFGSLAFISKTYPMSLWGRWRNKVFWDWEYDRIYINPLSLVVITVISYYVYPYIAVQLAYYFIVVSCLLFMVSLQAVQNLDEWLLTGKHCGDMHELNRRENSSV